MLNPIKILNNFSLTEKLNLLQKQLICANDLNHAYDFSNWFMATKTLYKYCLEKIIYNLEDNKLEISYNKLENFDKTFINKSFYQNLY